MGSRGSADPMGSPGSADPMKGALVIEQLREEIAGMLLGAYTSRQPVEPLTEKYDDLTMADAYEIQLLQVGGGWRRSPDQGPQGRADQGGDAAAAGRRPARLRPPAGQHVLRRSTSRSRRRASCSRGSSRRSPSCYKRAARAGRHGRGRDRRGRLRAAGPGAHRLTHRGLEDRPRRHHRRQRLLRRGGPRQHAGPAGRRRPAAGRLRPAPQRRAGRDGRRRRGARLADRRPGLGGQRAGRARRRRWSRATSSCPAR